MKRKAKKKPPVNPTAWCALHERQMNDVYIHRRGCLLRNCKHLKWLNGTTGAGPPRPKGNEGAAGPTGDVGSAWERN